MTASKSYHYRFNVLSEYSQHTAFAYIRKARTNAERTMASARGRRRDEGFRAPVLLLLIFAIALFAAVVAVSGSPCLHTSSNNASVIKLRHCNLWTLYHWCRRGFGSDEGGVVARHLVSLLSSHGAGDDQRRRLERWIYGMHGTYASVFAYCCHAWHQQQE